MTAWDEVRHLVENGGLDELAARVADLGDAERREVARELPGYLRPSRREAGAFDSWRWRGVRAEHLRVAGAGSLGGAAAAATWLNRRELAISPWETPVDTGALIKVISAREPAWQADLVARLVLRIRTSTSPGLPLVLALLRGTGVTPPEHDPLVLGWLATPPTADGLRRDPLLDTLLPRIFEAQGVGRALREERSDPLYADSWLGVLVALSGEGSGSGVRRETLLAGCVSRFLRGGDAVDLRFFVRLHELLEPTYAEVEARARDYLRLLPAAPGPVAELALRHVRRLDHLDPADVAEALEGLLFRAESGLVRTGLTWLDQTLRRSPERADELAPALVSAFGHETYAVRERAARLAVRHAAHLTPLGAETLRSALGALPPDLGRLLAGAVGGEAGHGWEEPEVLAPPPLPPPDPAGAFPDPPGTVDELVRAHLSGDWQEAERWLAGFVRFAAEDREALRAALARGGHQAHDLYESENWYAPRDWFAAMAAELVFPGADPGPVARKAPEVSEGWGFGSLRIEAREEGGGMSFGAFLAGARDHVMRLLVGYDRGGWVPEPSVPPADGPDAAGSEEGHRPLRTGRGLTDPGEGEEFVTILETGDSSEARDSRDVGAAGSFGWSGHEGSAGHGVTGEVGFFGWSGHDGSTGDGGFAGYNWFVGDGGSVGHDGFAGHDGSAWYDGSAGYGDPGETRPDRLPKEHRTSVPHRFVLRRCAEVLAALRAGTLPPVLLATPTAATGHLDPAAFLARLETVEATGAEPLPADFQQALLRLPGTAAPEVVARAGRLTSEAGRRAARWLAEGPVEPEARVRWRFTENGNPCHTDEREPPAGADLTPVPWVRADPTGLPLVDELVGEVSYRDWDEHGRYMGWWPAVLPSHREVVAAHYLPHLLHIYYRPTVQPEYVEALAACDGPVGEHTALLLAFFLAQRDPAHGVRLTVRMAARGDLPAEALGRQLVLLTERTRVKLPHAVAGLGEAAGQGAHREVWEVIRAALPHVLPGEGERPRPGATDLVALGVEVARLAGARGEIPGLAPPSRRSSSGFGRQCRRLHDYLVRS
ncbi:hypothetical protein [Streptosporangium sp. NPDC002721]|uniref:hypothetical protein n=1 Tax=Streptosporangium sp. NPDC002721 TaxID=3366188 RepID=UPI0036854B70